MIQPYQRSWKGVSTQPSFDIISPRQLKVPWRELVLASPFSVFGVHSDSGLNCIRKHYNTCKYFYIVQKIQPSVNFLVYTCCGHVLDRFLENRFILMNKVNEENTVLSVVAIILHNNFCIIRVFQPNLGSSSHISSFYLSFSTNSTTTKKYDYLLL